MYKKAIKIFNSFEEYFEDKKKYPDKRECGLKINHIGKVELCTLEGV